MLTHPIEAVDEFFADLRDREFARLDERAVAYLDYAGSALPAASLISADHDLLAGAVFGNPHSAHGSSQASAQAIEAARRRVLRFLAAGDDYVVCFTANASAAIKLVAEAYPFSPASICVLSADNHNSVNGIREYARRAGARVEYLPLADDLRLSDPNARLHDAGGGGLFAFPAQSNFSGVHHPLSLVRTAQSRGLHVLLDAAGFVPAHPLSLRVCPADFVAISFYKIFGHPTGVGALVARRDALQTLARPWFAGGTVDYASVQLQQHQLRQMPEAFEDGTPNFLGIAALEYGFTFMDWIGMKRLSAHVGELGTELRRELLALRRMDGSPLVRIYGPAGHPGGTVTFNVQDGRGGCVPYDLVEDRANAAGVHLRGGCFCNPGAAEAAFQFDAGRMAACLGRLDGGFSIPRLRACLGDGMAVGAVRASLGIANNDRDIARAVDVIASFA